MRRFGLFSADHGRRPLRAAGRPGDRRRRPVAPAARGRGRARPTPPYRAAEACLRLLDGRRRHWPADGAPRDAGGGDAASCRRPSPGSGPRPRSGSTTRRVPGSGRRAPRHDLVSPDRRARRRGRRRVVLAGRAGPGAARAAPRCGCACGSRAGQPARPLPGPAPDLGGPRSRCCCGWRCVRPEGRPDDRPAGRLPGATGAVRRGGAPRGRRLPARRRDVGAPAGARRRVPRPGRQGAAPGAVPGHLRGLRRRRSSRPCPRRPRSSSCTPRSSSTTTSRTTASCAAARRRCTSSTAGRWPSTPATAWPCSRSARCGTTSGPLGRSAGRADLVGVRLHGPADRRRPGARARLAARRPALDLTPDDYLDMIMRKTCWYTTLLPLRVGALDRRPAATRPAADAAVRLPPRARRSRSATTSSTSPDRAGRLRQGAARRPPGGQADADADPPRWPPPRRRDRERVAGYLAIDAGGADRRRHHRRSWR